MSNRKGNSKTKPGGLVTTVFFIIILLIAGYQALSKPSNPVDVAPTTLAGNNGNNNASNGNSGNNDTNNNANTGSIPSWLTVYFTNPNPPDDYGKGIDQEVQPMLDAATKTIDVTSFDLNIPSLINSLASASKRGVKVRVVYDGTNGSLDLENDVTNNKTFDAVKILKAAKVSLVDGGRSNGLMHDKMIIIDSKILFVGSWNLSYNDSYRNNNNLLKITNAKLIANYQAKFNEMFIDKLFGTHAEVKVPNPSIIIGGIQVENYFSPEDEVMDKLVAYVQGAKESVHFIIFTFTAENLASAMIERDKAGIDVQGVIENRGAEQGALVSLYCAKLPVKVDGNKYTMHHKVIIIDNQTVITGSFNFTKAANEANDDNVLILHSPAVAALYEQEYQRINSAGKPTQVSAIKCGK
jgi:phosphatidylserine/phosphatidylglycerophosphate/cardiolipin synthase-like enzyme